MVLYSVGEDMRRSIALWLSSSSQPARRSVAVRAATNEGKGGGGGLFWGFGYTKKGGPRRGKIVCTIRKWRAAKGWRFPGGGNTLVWHEVGVADWRRRRSHAMGGRGRGGVVKTGQRVGGAI